MAETKTTIPVEIKMGNAGTNDANLPAFKEGSIIFTKDTKKIYIDPVGETERIAVGGGEVDLSGKQGKFADISYEDNIVDNDKLVLTPNVDNDISEVYFNISGASDWRSGTKAISAPYFKTQNGYIIANTSSMPYILMSNTTTKATTPTINFESATGNAVKLTGIAAPDADDDVANKKYVDENVGAGKKLNTSEIFNDYAGNKTYLYDGVRVTNVTSTTNSSTFTLESVAGLAVGGTFKVYTDVFHLLINETFTIAAVDSINKTITTTTKYSFNTENLYIVNSTATDTVSLFAYCAHAEGNKTTATGVGSHAEGFSSKATGDYSHAEGASNTATGVGSHAEGNISIASGVGSHAEGFNSKATGDYSHAEGYQTTAGYDNQTTMGMYNINKSDTLLEVGNGSTQTASNAFEVYRDGHAEVQTMGVTDTSLTTKKYVDDTLNNKQDNLKLKNNSKYDSQIIINPASNSAEILDIGMVNSVISMDGVSKSISLTAGSTNLFIDEASGISVNYKKIIGVIEPTDDNGVTNKKYVDDIKTELLNAITHPYTYDETTKELTLIL